MSTAKKAPNSQRPIERKITIDKCSAALRCWVSDHGGRGFVAKSAQEIVDILSQNPAVEELEIFEQKGKITSEVISAIFQLENLTSLDMWKNDIHCAEATEIASHFIGSNVKYLRLRFNKIGDRGATAIANNLVGSNLTNLDLEINEIGDAGAAEIAKNLVGSSLTTLDLSYNQILDEGAAAFAKNLVGSSLTCLRLQRYICSEDQAYGDPPPLELFDKWDEVGNDPDKLVWC